MGLFGRRHAKTAPEHASPAARGACSCPEHIEGLLEVVVPMTLEMRAEVGEDQAMTVAELIECSALDVQPAQDRWFFDPRSGRRDDGPYHWTVWVGDEARMSYDDDAPVQLDEALADRPGVELVAWEDREIIHVGAPTLCRDGLLAAAARALQDPRVRIGES